MDENNFSEGKFSRGTAKELSLQLESPVVEVMIVFNNIEVMLNVREDRIYYFMALDSIYINEKS